MSGLVLMLIFALCLIISFLTLHGIALGIAIGVFGGGVIAILVLFVWAIIALSQFK